MIDIEKPLFIFTTWGADPLHYHQNKQDVAITLGEEVAAFWINTIDFLRELNTVEGWLLPQYSMRREWN